MLLLLVLLLALAGHGARNAYLAAEDLQQARTGLSRLDDAALDEAGPAVDAALASVDRARSRLSAPSVGLLRWTPVLGRSIKAERAIARAAGSSLKGVQAITRAVPAIRTPEGFDLTAVRALGDQLPPLTRTAQGDLEAVRALRTEWTPQQVGAAVSDVDRELTRVVDLLDQAGRGADLAAGLLGEAGPRNVLVALGNNAELRGTGGYVSTFATGRLQDGRLTLDAFQDVAAVQDQPGQARKVPAPAEYVEDFGPFLADTTLFREWTMSPDVPDSASVASAALGELLGQAPDVVLLLDVPALSGIVQLAGSTVALPDGSTVPTDRLTEALLVDSYAAAGASPQAQLERRAALRGAAGSTATSLLTSGTPPGSVLREVARLAQGRHLAVWSADAEEQATLEDLGLAGSADPEGDDLALISINNLNANKLDYYVDREVEVTVTVGRDSAEVLQRLVLSNRAPEDLVPYVAGTAKPGTVVERLEFSIAQQAHLRSFQRDGSTANGELRRGAERTRVHTYVELARGESTAFELRYTVPVTNGRYRLRLLPQPLARDAALRVNVAPVEGLSIRGSDRARPAGPVRLHGPWNKVEVLSVVAH
jgi:hypothetical protein